MGDMYDADRLRKIGEILPGLCSYARKGDEIQLGLDGDPLFPVSYRGSNRPTGVIENIDNEGDATVVTARMNDGTTKKLSSRTVSAYDSWEFTDRGFATVKEREEIAAARSETMDEYRGISDENVESKMARLESDLSSFGQTHDAFRKTVIATLKEIASDVDALAVSNGQKTKFCSFLTERYDDMMQARSEISFRGVETSDVQTESVASPVAAQQENEKLSFSDDDQSLISDDDDSDDD
jgi:hypothetical protein